MNEEQRLLKAKMKSSTGGQGQVRKRTLQEKEGKDLMTKTISYQKTKKEKGGWR